MLWFRGQVCETADAVFNMTDRGLLLADGLFETILAVDGRPVLLDEHLMRLGQGCTTLGIPCDTSTVRQAVDDLVAAKTGNAIIRATVTRGAGSRGLQPPADAVPTLFATRSEWLPAIAFTTPSLATSSIRRNASSPLSQLKSLSYLDNILALQEAQRSQADDALILTTEGNVACTSAANLFIVEGNRLVTAPVGAGILPGIIRGLILSSAPALGLEAREEAFGLDRAMAADGMFLTNSVRLVMRPRSVDGQPLSGRAAATLQRIENLVCQAVWPTAASTSGV